MNNTKALSKKDRSFLRKFAFDLKNHENRKKLPIKFVLFTIALTLVLIAESRNTLSEIFFLFTLVSLGFGLTDRKMSKSELEPKYEIVNGLVKKLEEKHSKKFVEKAKDVLLGNLTKSREVYELSKIEVKNSSASFAYLSQFSKIFNPLRMIR